MDNLLESIKEHEGFIPKPYIDILVQKYPNKYGVNKYLIRILKRHIDKLKLTFGYGFTFLTKEESSAVLEIRLRNIIIEIESRELFFKELPTEKRFIIVEMAYQLGVSGLFQFRNMWSALKRYDYETASIEMLDSRWAKQTPVRAKELSELMSK